MPIHRRTRALDPARFGTTVKSSSSPVPKIANRGWLGTRAFDRIRGLGRGNRHDRFTDLRGLMYGFCRRHIVRVPLHQPRFPSFDVDLLGAFRIAGTAAAYDIADCRRRAVIGPGYTR